MSGEPIGPTLSWAEQFRATHHIEKLPQEVRMGFDSLLRQREGIVDYYRSFPAGRWDERIGTGNSAKDDIVDLIATSKMRNEALQTGKLAWVDPGKNTLRELGEAELLDELDTTTAAFFETLSKTDPSRIILVPTKEGIKEVKVSDFVWDAERHEVGHLFLAFKFADQFGLYTPDKKPIKRPPSAVNLWGNNEN